MQVCARSRALNQPPLPASSSCGYQMYKGGKPVRDRNGKIVKAAEFQESQAGKARVQPDRRWFGNTRVIGQAELDRFRAEMSKQVNDPYQVVLKQTKLPMSLLTEPSTVRPSKVRNVGRNVGRRALGSHRRESTTE